MMKLKVFIVSLFACLGLCFAYGGNGMTVQAAPVDVFKKACENAPQGPKAPPACQEKNVGTSNPLFGPEGILTKIINILSIVIAIIAVIGIMVAGLKFIVEGSNPQEVTNARNGVLYAAIALIIAAAAQLMVRFILYKIGET